MSHLQHIQPLSANRGTCRPGHHAARARPGAIRDDSMSSASGRACGPGLLGPRRPLLRSRPSPSPPLRLPVTSLLDVDAHASSTLRSFYANQEAIGSMRVT